MRDNVLISFTIEDHMLFHLRFKFLLYDLYPLNLQEIAMPSVFIYRNIQRAFKQMAR